MGTKRMRLVAYTRVSTEAQVRDGVSLKAQRGRLAAYCKAHGHQLVRVETDDGVSGNVPPEKRAGLARALAALRAREADGILVLKLDRLSRRVRDVLDLIDEAKRKKWNVASVEENLDTSTAMGRFTVKILASLAEMEREQTGERTRVGLDQVAREGRARSRFAPFGYRTHDGGIEQQKGDRRQLVEHAAEQAVLSKIERLRQRGLGARRIAARLNAKAVLNPRTASVWNYRAVERALATAKRRRLLHAA